MPRRYVAMSLNEIFASTQGRPDPPGSFGLNAHSHVREQVIRDVGVEVVVNDHANTKPIGAAAGSWTRLCEMVLPLVAAPESLSIRKFTPV